MSTLAKLIPGGGEAGRAWPDPELGGPSGVLLVCRSHQAGMAAASAAMTQWMAGHTPPVQVWALVIVADAPGKLPRPLHAQRSRLAGTARQTVYVPWVPAWRLGPPQHEHAPKEIAQLGRDMHSGPWIHAKGS